MSRPKGPPFELADQLNRDSSVNLAIRHGIPNTAEGWNSCLARDLETRITNDIYPFLSLVATQDATHIDPLHKHMIKRRTIIVAEDPKLHLVWFYETIYIKPLPDYLLNYAIWENHITISPTQPISNESRYDKHRAALGFLRTYSLLIRHESDFIIAQKAHLLPKYISFQSFQMFIQPFRSLNNYDVSHRYHYGQFRLTRLNLAIRLARIANILHLFRSDSGRKLPWNYQEQLWQTSQYLQHYAAPLIFIFAILSLILSSMQVVLAALGSTTWEVFVRVSWGFSIGTIIFAILPVVGTIIGVSILSVAQGQFAMRMRWKGMSSKNSAQC